MTDREKFIAATGREPEQDDLERIACQLAGEVGHFGCGWCDVCDKPRFVCGHIFVAAEVGKPER